MNKFIDRLIIFLLCNFWTIFVIVGPVLFFVIDDDTWVHNVNERHVSERVKGYSFQDDDVWKIVQVSDTHLSHQYPNREEQFKHIIERIKLIKPKFSFFSFLFLIFLNILFSFFFFFFSLSLFPFPFPFPILLILPFKFMFKN